MISLNKLKNLINGKKFILHQMLFYHIITNKAVKKIYFFLKIYLLKLKFVIAYYPANGGYIYEQKIQP